MNEVYIVEHTYLDHGIEIKERIMYCDSEEKAREFVNFVVKTECMEEQYATNVVWHIIAIDEINKVNPKEHIVYEKGLRNEYSERA